MRHAFWRRPDGVLHKSDDDRYAPVALLQEIGLKATVKGDSISWPFTGLHDYQTAAYPSIGIISPDGSELNEADSVSLVSRAANGIIRQLGGGKPVLPKALLAKVNIEAASLFRQSTTKGILVTSVSVDNWPSIPINVVGCDILAADLANYPYPEPLVTQTSYVTPHITRTTYSTVAVQSEQITSHQAFDISMTALNFVRGIWNHILTYRSASVGWSQVPRRKWIGVIHVGPVYTLHTEDGALDNDAYWYEPDYVEDANIHKPKSWETLKEAYIQASESIDTLPYKRDLIDLFARYAIALDQANLDVAFLMLWSLLERITDTVGGNYDDTIERAIWFFKDHSIAKQLLRQMRWRRNQFVHSAGSAEDRDQLCYITKSFVDVHSKSLVRNELKINDIKEYGEFLGLPRDQSRLEHLREWYKRAFELQTQIQSSQDQQA